MHYFRTNLNLLRSIQFSIFDLEAIHSITRRFRKLVIKPATTAIMSQRFPPPSSDEASSLGSQLEAEFKRGYGHSNKFEYRDQNGAPMGPFAVLV